MPEKTRLRITPTKCVVKKANRAVIILINNLPTTAIPSRIAMNHTKGEPGLRRVRSLKIWPYEYKECYQDGDDFNIYCSSETSKLGVDYSFKFGLLMIVRSLIAQSVLRLSKTLSYIVPIRLPIVTYTL